MTPDASQDARPEAPGRIGFLGPQGTFTEEALLSQLDYAQAELVAYPSLAEVLEAVRTG